MRYSIVIPMYNEGGVIGKSIPDIDKTIKSLNKDYEIIAVNDGSKDNTLQILKNLSKKYSKLKIITYGENRGMGYACKKGFEEAKGEYIVTADSDLSYDSEYIIKLIKVLEENPDVDIVTVSPYMKGGQIQTKGSFIQHIISKLGTKIMKTALGQNIHTITALYRAYRKDVIDSLDIDSNNQEINIEILFKAAALGYNIKEIPAVMKTRVAGQSKFKLFSGIKNHLMLSLYTKPTILFGVVGLIILVAGIAYAIFLINLYYKGTLNPNAPLINSLVILLILLGAQIIFFNFIASQIGRLRKEIYKIQKENKLLKRKIKP